MASTPSSRSRVHSRRGSTSLNFSNMSLFPLTSSSSTVLDLDEHSFFSSPTTNNPTSFSSSSTSRNKSKPRNGSYIQHTSAPTTPGILSPNLSSYFTPVSPSSHVTLKSGTSTPRTARSRSRRNSNHNLVDPFTSSSSLSSGQQQGYSHESYITDLPKSKSTTQLYLDLQHHASHNAWMHRTGAALSSESREYKGQSWLVSRASSTSLVDDNVTGGGVSGGGNAGAGNSGYWDAEEWATGRHGARGRSRNARRSSRPGSTSRGVSRDFNPRMTEYSSENEDEDDQAEDDDVEETDDEEYLYRERGYGLGMWVDRIIGWSLFSVDDDEEEEEYRKDPYGEGRRKRKQQQKHQQLHLSASTQPHTTPAGTRQSEDDDGDDETWGDPSWVFSIATEVLF